MFHFSVSLNGEFSHSSVIHVSVIHVSVIHVSVFVLTRDQTSSWTTWLSCFTHMALHLFLCEELRVLSRTVHVRSWVSTSPEPWLSFISFSHTMTLQSVFLHLSSSLSFFSLDVSFTLCYLHFSSRKIDSSEVSGR